jgi:hypothetical protein
MAKRKTFDDQGLLFDQVDVKSQRALDRLEDLIGRKMGRDIPMGFTNAERRGILDLFESAADKGEFNPRQSEFSFGTKNPKRGRRATPFTAELKESLDKLIKKHGSVAAIPDSEAKAFAAKFSKSPFRKGVAIKSGKDAKVFIETLTNQVGYEAPTPKKTPASNKIINPLTGEERTVGGAKDKRQLEFDFEGKTQTDSPQKTKSRYNPVTDQGGEGPQQAGAKSKTAAKTAAKTAGKKAGKAGLLRSLGGGARAMAGGLPGMALLALSVLPMLAGSGKLASDERKKEVERLMLQERMKREVGRDRGNPAQRYEDRVYGDRLDSAMIGATRRESPVSPELVALLGGEQGRLEALQNQMGRNQLSLDQVLRQL